MNRKWIMFISIVSLVLLLAACGKENKPESEAPIFEVPEISEEEKLAKEDLVVTVNDEEVNGLTYNLVYTQLKLHAMQTGQEYSDEEIKDMTIDSLIDRQLLIQKAKEEGITITNEDAAAELERLREENEDGLNNLLEQYQLTEDLFRQQIQFEMTMEKYLTEQVEVTVTDEEVEEVYEEAKEEDEDLPELAEIRDTIKSQLENQRTSEALETQINNFKENSDIDIHL